MHDASHSRFPALYKAIGKMSGREQAAVSPFGFDVEEEDLVTPAQPFAPAHTTPELRPRPPVAKAVTVAWVPADIDSAERRVQRLARVRAERELAHERERIEQTVSRIRRAHAESALQDSRSTIVAMENRLKTGGHTGRLGWMEAQILKMRRTLSHP